MAVDAAQQINVDLPPILAPLFRPMRYKVMYGGRGSGKSWGVARALLIDAMRQPLRVLCAREIMRTVADSVHRLLADQIVAMGMQDWYEVTDTAIRGRVGSEFLFTGLRAIDAAKIKSYEGVDVAWVEEAQALSKKSREILLPTIRAPDSELWFTFNPELDSDDVYQYFVVNTPPGTWLQRMTWRDNPWFPDVLEAERAHLEKTDPEAYRHVWEGECRTVVEGAIYAREMLQAIEKRRIRPTPHDPALPVHTIWDLGWNDAMTIIMVQRLPSAVMVIGYIEDSFRTYAEYVKQLNELDYVWGWDYLPHDGEHKDPKAGKSAKQVLEGLRRRVKIIPRSDVESGIKAARMMFPRVYFDDTVAEESATGYVGVGRLVECLKRYRRSIPTTTGEPAHPVHDEYSHGADAFRGLAMIVDQITNDDRPARNIPASAPQVHGRGTGL